MNNLVRGTREKLGTCRRELEKSAQGCLELENKLRSQTANLSAMTEKYQELWRALGFIEVDNLL
jgi:hypothetical protein